MSSIFVLYTIKSHFKISLPSKAFHFLYLFHNIFLKQQISLCVAWAALEFAISSVSEIKTTTFCFNGSSMKIWWICNLYLLIKIRIIGRFEKMKNLYEQCWNSFLTISCYILDHVFSKTWEHLRTEKPNVRNYSQGNITPPQKKMLLSQRGKLKRNSWIKIF